MSNRVITLKASGGRNLFVDARAIQAVSPSGDLRETGGNTAIWLRGANDPIYCLDHCDVVLEIWRAQTD